MKQTTNNNISLFTLGGMDATVTKQQWSLQSKLPRLKSAGMLILILGLALFASCKDPEPTHTHEWEWLETAPATPTADGLETETCKTCKATRDTRIIEQTEPTAKTFNDQIMFVDNGTNYLADIIDARTACGKQNLQQLGIVEKLKNATSGVYTNATGLVGNAMKTRARNVFGENNTKGKVKITIENNVNYESYEVDDSANIRFNIAYLTAVSNDDLQTTITAAVQEMEGKIGETPQPIDKTYPITLKDGALVFTVEYKALPTDEEPAYLAYIKERLETIANSTALDNVGAVNYLLGKGNSFTITIKYGGTSFTGMNWNTAEQSFEIHNDWIATATGNTLSLAILREAFNSVEAE